MRDLYFMIKLLVLWEDFEGLGAGFAIININFHVLYPTIEF